VALIVPPVRGTDKARRDTGIPNLLLLLPVSPPGKNPVHPGWMITNAEVPEKLYGKTTGM
jgi:hypothetical protein